MMMIAGNGRNKSQRGIIGARIGDHCWGEKEERVGEKDPAASCLSRAPAVYLEEEWVGGTMGSGQLWGPIVTSVGPNSATLNGEREYSIEYTEYRIQKMGSGQLWGPIVTSVVPTAQ